MKPPPDRTRGLPRVRVPMTARLTAVGKEPDVYPVRDLGLGGVFLESDTCLRLGDLCTLEVGIEDGPENPKLVATGRAVRVEPGSTGAKRELARAYAGRFQYLDAIEQWRDVLARNPGTVAPNLEIARLYRAINVRNRAIDFYSRVLEIEPDHTAARRELDALLQGGR